MAQTYTSTIIPPRAVAQTVSLDPISSPVGLSFTVSGISDCQEPKIIIKDSDGNVVYGPIVASNVTSIGTQYSFSHDITLRQAYKGATLVVYCDNVDDGAPVTLDIVEAVKPVENYGVMTEAAGYKHLVFTFDINIWKSKDQSAVLVVKGRTRDGNLVEYSHIFSNAVPKRAIYDFGLVKPGVYTGRFTFVDGHSSVTTVRQVKVLS
jgi:hypothetical protein